MITKRVMTMTMTTTTLWSMFVEAWVIHRFDGSVIFPCIFVWLVFAFWMPNVAFIHTQFSDWFRRQSIPVDSSRFQSFQSTPVISVNSSAIQLYSLPATSIERQRREKERERQRVSHGDVTATLRVRQLSSLPGAFRQECRSEWSIAGAIAQLHADRERNQWSRYRLEHTISERQVRVSILHNYFISMKMAIFPIRSQPETVIFTNAISTPQTMLNACAFQRNPYFNLENAVLQNAFHCFATVAAANVQQWLQTRLPSHSHAHPLNQLSLPNALVPLN